MLSRQNVACVSLLAWAAVIVALTLVSEIPMPSAALCYSAAGVIGVIAIGGRIAGGWIGPLFGSLGVTAVGVIGIGGLMQDVGFAAAGLLGLIVVGAAAPIVVLLAQPSRGPAESSAPAAPIDLHRTNDLLEKLHEQSMLSDSAKRILYRDRELDLLRRAIEDDIRSGDYNAAISLCDDLTNVFGYRQEAEGYRTRIERARRDNYDAEVHAALTDLDDLLSKRNWMEAHEVAARTRRLFPESHVAQTVEERFHRARDEHKRQLEEAFVDAANREDVELAMHKLRELDRYLTPDETSTIAELAEMVVAKHRDNLGVQFKLAVNDHRWADAAKTGDTIIAEFPNTKMAEEVRSMIEVLRTRAEKTGEHVG